MTAADAARLSIQGLSHAFGATRALQEVSLVARAGEIVALVGENGAGKSTLMRILAGEMRADAGRIELDGKPYAPASPAEARAGGLGFVSQELSLCPSLSVADNLLLGREPRRFGLVDRRALQRQARDALATVAGDASVPGLALDARVETLPMARRQLVEIARALAATRQGRGVLLLDEPTSSLGQQDTARLFSLLRKLRDSGVTVLYVSHFLEEVQEIAERFVVLRDGRVVGSGSMAQVSLPEIVTMMAGREIDERFGRSAERRAGDVVLETGELAGERKPERVTLALRRGEVLGIAGLMGSGRTELLRVIFGLDSVRSGKVRVGAWSGPASPTRRLAQGVGMASEDRKGEGLATALSVAHNLTLSRLPTSAGLGWVWPSEPRRIAERWMRELGIKARSAEQSVGELSGGNQQKVALARLLHHGLDVLLLDEPTRGIDVASKAQIYALVDRLACEGKAILLVSSYLPELLGACDRIAVMRRGALGPARPAADWTEQQLLEHATGAQA